MGRDADGNSKLTANAAATMLMQNAAATMLMQNAAGKMLTAAVSKKLMPADGSKKRMTAKKLRTDVKVTADGKDSIMLCSRTHEKNPQREESETRDSRSSPPQEWIFHYSWW